VYTTLGVILSHHKLPTVRVSMSSVDGKAPMSSSGSVTSKQHNRTGSSGSSSSSSSSMLTVVSSPALLSRNAAHRLSAGKAPGSPGPASPGMIKGNARPTTVYSPRARRASSTEAQIVLNSYTIPSQLFKDAHKQSTDSPPAMKLMDRHLANGATKHATLAENSWRQMLVSPLVGFLTDIKNRGEWVQLSGHQGNFLPGRGGTICKKWCEGEKMTYEALMEESEPLKEYVPLFFKEIEVVSGEKYIELQDLLSQFSNPSVMDCKMGTRTFLETEVAKKTKRKDLLAKMVKLDPDEPTSEENDEGITKLRYMVFREMLSSSRTLGFRIEGIKLGGQEPLNSFKTKREFDDVADVMRAEFLPQKCDAQTREKIRQGFHSRLLDLRDTMASSRFFQNHELIGTSLLFVYDLTGNTGVWMIDFGKTIETESPITHTTEWTLGNHEDGYLLGLETITRMFSVY